MSAALLVVLCCHQCTCISTLTSWYLSMQRPRHFWSLLLRLLPGLLIHILKQWSRTVCGAQQGGHRAGRETEATLELSTGSHQGRCCMHASCSEKLLLLGAQGCCCNRLSAVCCWCCVRVCQSHLVKLLDVLHPQRGLHLQDARTTDGRHARNSSITAAAVIATGSAHESRDAGML